ncbi:MAG: hypothetical protein FJX57_06685, partial [Alphaproteobacteria bacterium]|nr:hypothetical protein [Alphaproteobacteria bacterium]
MATVLPWGVASAQSPIVVGLLSISLVAGELFLRTLRTRLREQGFVDGRDITLESRHSDNTAALIHDRARELAKLRPAVIVASGAS